MAEEAEIVEPVANDAALDMERATAKAVARMIRISPQKLNLVAMTLRGKPVSLALNELQLSRRRIAGTVRKLLWSAVSNAVNNDGLNPDALYVKEAYVGKAMVMKRFRVRGRGRASRILKPFSNMTIVLEEREGVN